MEYQLDLTEAIDVIRATSLKLSEAKFKVDPLFSKSKSFEMSLRSSAGKRHGQIIEAAVRDALQTSDRILAYKIPKGDYSREVDVFCINKIDKQILAIDVKRGNGDHDSGKKKDMKQTTNDMTVEIKDNYPDYNVRHGFLHYYSDTKKGHVDKITLRELQIFSGVDVTKFVDHATMLYSREVDKISELRCA